MAVETHTTILERTPEDWNAGLPAGSTFMFDPMHMPHPLSPLGISIYETTWSEGATQGFRDMNVPIRAWHYLARNSYLFMWFEMEDFANPEAAQHAGAIAEATLRPLTDNLLETWESDRLPRIQEELTTLRTLLADIPTSTDVPTLLRRALAAQREIIRIHFTVVAPMSAAMQLFDEFHAELFGGSQEDGHTMLAGQVNGSVRAGFGLSDLASLARDLGLTSLILDTKPSDAMDSLVTTGSGRSFLAALHAYLEEFGLRQDLFEIADPTWQERPDYALSTIRTYLRTSYDARAHHATIQQRAATALAETRARLSTYPQPVRDQFEALLTMASEASYLQEEHNFHLDQPVQALMHHIFRAAGERLVRSGALPQVDDIFMLTVPEILAAFESPSPASRADLVDDRHRQLAFANTLTPPPFIGEPPSGPPPTESPVERGNLRFFGSMAPVSDDPATLIGNPGARGIATGLARVVRSLEEAQALEPGEILVTITTMPPWSPLFGIAAGVVTETGGPLSHCAIVSREYAIPAVVGATGATSRIVTGQRIRIDGSTGEISLDAEG